MLCAVDSREPWLKRKDLWLSRRERARWSAGRQCNDLDVCDGTFDRGKIVWAQWKPGEQMEGERLPAQATPQQDAKGLLLPKHGLPPAAALD